MATLVADVRTPLSLEDGLHALTGGYTKIMGAPCESVRELACLGAQLCLESGNFQRAHCFNWGNHKLPHDWDGLYTQFTCDEIFDVATANQARRLGPCSIAPWKNGPKFRVVLYPPHPWSSFVAFDTAEDGAADYVRLLSCKDSYRQAWHEAVMGRPEAFSHALGSAHYYSADAETYTRGVVSIFNRLLPVCARLVDGNGHGIDDELREHVQAIVFESLRDMGRDRDTEPAPPLEEMEGAPV